MNLFGAKEQLKSVSIELIFAFIPALRVHLCIQVITNRFNNLIEVILMKVAYVGNVSTVFVDKLVQSYGPLTELLHDN